MQDGGVLLATVWCGPGPPSHPEPLAGGWARVAWACGICDPGLFGEEIFLLHSQSHGVSDGGLASVGGPGPGPGRVKELSPLPPL